VVIFVPDQNKLSQYQQKRDFTKTAEPSGENKVLASNVIQARYPWWPRSAEGVGE
jgi:hypothetical protein